MYEISSYSFTGYNCQQPNDVHEYNVQQLCTTAETKVKNQVNQTITLLQYDSIRKLNGYSCTKTTSSFKLYCGAFSHEKIPTVPQIEIREEVSEEECREWVKQKRYVNTRRMAHPLTINTENIFYETPVGQVLVRNDNVECQGETMKIGGQILDQVVEMKQIKIVISEDKFKFKGNRGESRNQHVQLPNHCHLTTAGCTTPQATYIWEFGEEYCALERVRTVRGRIENQVFIDEEKLIRIKLLKPSTRDFQGCPNIQLINTEYDKLFVALQDTKEFPTITETAIDIAEYIATREDFMMYEIEEKLLTLEEDQDTQTCMREFQFRQQNGIFPWKKEGNMFAQFQGEVLSIFNCHQVTVTPREDPQCYEELPVFLEEEKLFLQPITHRLMKHGSIRPCEKMKSPKYQTDSGVWISMNPGIHIEPKPLLLHHKQIQMKHLDMSSGGLFTTGQLQQWEDAINFEDYQTSINRRINIQACNEESCISNNYQTGGVREILVHELENISIRAWILKMLQQFGQWCSITVAVIWITQFLYRIGTFCITCRQDGSSPALKLLYVYFMKDHMLYQEFYQMRKQRIPDDEVNVEEQL